ncbi:NADP-dependent oxidoreductase [Amycolatopsis decaplanina]|uniref:Putative alcohol dehydrogenase n=1 Tax=Amycolatopsis decaplanina DSM 44594 TaxID=1284240 RepID=M2Z9M5_9PSEU|nr:NADP-dependent oxidoreductase [Amycolatopsis decaplanina]EME57638.1 putative alcohol dehydrogenase [Amycolatopsis decaplanina DSM 44594]
MRAVGTTEFGAPEVLKVVDVPLPEPGDGEVRIRTQAATINNFDLVARSGGLGPMLPAGPLYVFGWDIAGIVDKVGPGVTGFVRGDVVVGMSDWLRTKVGTQAEFAVLAASALAPAPDGVTPASAASLPVNALTAARALNLMGLHKGQAMAVTGAAGAVGGFALELGRHRGLDVIGIGSAKDREFIVERGARFIERSDHPVKALAALEPGGVDGLLDAATIGPAMLEAVRDGGAFASLTPPKTPRPERDIQVHRIHTESDGLRLRELVSLVERGVLTLRRTRTFPFEEAATAHRLLAEGGVRGRLVLTP